MIILSDSKATKAAGAQLAQGLCTGQDSSLLITLQGPLGAGKTTFVKGFASALEVPSDQVTSPSFTLANVYQGRVQIVHLDLYRLSDDPQKAVSEFYDAGLDEYLTGVTLIEWPERLPLSFWPEERILVSLELTNEGKRALTLEGVNFTLSL
ncbi:MAG: tRNA (adenosine(37)-N6)-threonylcarbamoyltransferase complex ATPase subunit type 1 TsaE [Deltaproteobacteria bacterium]|nr:tRNA (adenosine(37)-N6)-threonylcarbamoyltransferase complex ATPase subunit type 1 TsaE [Deltaproteobacteria bacterium]